MIKNLFEYAIGIDIERNRLRIINAKTKIHDGLYRCIVFNSEGRGLSNEIKIFVDCKYHYYYYYHIATTRKSY